MVCLRNVAMWMFMTLPVVFLGGCSGGDAESPAEDETEASTSETHEGHDHGDHDHSHSGDLSVEEAMAALSPEDRKLAEEQRICPVTDGVLGEMGTPIKVQVSGQSVFICCEGCRDRLVDNPEEYLPKIGR